MKNTIRFVKEELTDDSNSCDFRKMMRGEKQIAGPEAWLGDNKYIMWLEDNKYIKGMWRNIG